MRALSRITCERGLPRRVGGPNARLPVCADQKIRTFTALAAHTDALVLPDTISLGAFADHIDDANAVPPVAAIIVQTRPPWPRPSARRARPGRPTKDIDALGVDSPHPACATADGIIAEPFLDPDTRVAIVGAVRSRPNSPTHRSQVKESSELSPPSPGTHDPAWGPLATLTG